MIIIRRALKLAYRAPQILLGIIICKIPIFTRYKQHLLSTWRDYDKRSVIDKVLYPYTIQVWFKFEYFKESNPDKREELKDLAMGGASAKAWVKHYNNKPLNLTKKLGKLTMREAVPLYDIVETILSNTESNYTVIQVGSSSGRELAYFATMFPQHQFLGADKYKEVIEFSSQHNSLPNLSYALVSAKDISQLLSPHRGKDILIYSSGALTYVQPEHLCEFFGSLVDYPSLKILIHEPANESKGKPDELKKSIWRGDLSYTHDYKYYAEKAGIETVKCKIIRPFVPYEDFHEPIGTGFYFYSGKIKPK